MTSEVTIRTATIDDFSAVCRLLHELDDHHVRIRPDVFQPFDGPPRPREHIAQLIDEHDSEIFLAEIGAEIGGLATIELTDSPNAPMFRPRPSAVMSDLVVNQKFQGLGIGKGLLDRAAEWTQSRKIACITINVWIDNETGLSFFGANGFTPLCQRMELRVDKEREEETKDRT